MFGCIKSRPGRSAGRTKRDHPQRQIRSLLEGQTNCPEQDTAVSRNSSDGLALHCLLSACTVKWTRQRSTLYRRVLSSIYCTTRHGQRTALCRKSCGEPLRTSNDIILQKKLWGTTEKLWGTTENLREQHTAEETGELLKISESRILQKKLGNYWRPQRAAHCRRNWGTTEDLRGQHTAEETGELLKTSEDSTLQKKLGNYWRSQRAPHCRRSCEEPLRTSEGKHTVEVAWNDWCPQRAEHCRRNWGTTEDLNGHHIAEEAVRNLRGQHTAEETVRNLRGQPLQKKLWGPQRVARCKRNWEYWRPQRTAHCTLQRDWFKRKAFLMV